MMFSDKELEQAKNLNLLTDTIKEILEMWLDVQVWAVEYLASNNLDLESHEQLPLLEERIYEDLIVAFQPESEPPRILREVRYKGQVLARLTRQGNLYRVEGFSLDKRGILSNPSDF